MSCNYQNIVDGRNRVRNDGNIYGAVVVDRHGRSSQQEHGQQQFMQLEGWMPGNLQSIYDMITGADAESSLVETVETV